MTRHDGIIATHQARLPGSRYRTKWSLVGLWIVLGCAALAADDFIEPRLASTGQLPFVRIIAEQWQQLGETAGILGFIAIVFIFGRDSMNAALVSLIAVAVAAQGSKNCFGRVRPHWTGNVTIFHGPLGYFNSGLPVPIDSFPSGHTAVAFAMAQVLAIRWPHGKWLWFSLAAGVAVSRTLVGVHFPSDAIFGALMGTLIGRWACNAMRNSTPRPLTDSDRGQQEYMPPVG